MSQNHVRSRPPSVADLDAINPQRALEIYKDRFSNAGDFTFVLVGSFTLDSVRPLVRRYLGNLPAGGRREDARDIGLAPPPGVVQREVHKGIEPKSQVPPWKPWTTTSCAFSTRTTAAGTSIGPSRSRAKPALRSRRPS